ncbi:cephalosporin hydroxylase family protein [Pseudooceanicola sp. MF1-13]|uniref:cephalosporin hydroxylase family protein n=1 Tax=Pseudooceanicola sp. MF1-13 TaxID=3379095 RepID=UPI003891E3E9
MTDFKQEIAGRIANLEQDKEINQTAARFLQQSAALQYPYNYHWLDRPIIQYPQDIVAMQEIIWEVRPDLIIETGIAHGGSLIFSASMLALMDMEDAIKSGETINPAESKRKVLGVDIDIRAHNKTAIEAHAMASRIQMIQGSSIADDVVAQVREVAAGYDRVLVCLDSMHTHDHVLAELEAYAPLTSKGSYCVVFDTLIEDMPEGTYPDRPWGPGNSPKSAVHEYIKTNPEFEIQKDIAQKLMITVTHDGFLKRV